MEACARIQQRGPLTYPVIASSRERIHPITFTRVEIEHFVAGIRPDRLHRDRSRIGGGGQDLLHSRIGLERLPLLDADGGQHPQDLWVLSVTGLSLNHFVHLLEDLVVHAVNRVDKFTGCVDERHLWRVVLLGQRVDA